MLPQRGKAVSPPTPLPAGTWENVVKYLARQVQYTVIFQERISAACAHSLPTSFCDDNCGTSRPPSSRSCIRENAEHRVHYFDWPHPSAKRRQMLAENLLEKLIVVRERTEPPPRWHLHCPHCERFTLVVVGKLLPIRAPT